MNTQPNPTPPRSPQQGSIVVILAIAMVMLIALLGSIQVGYTAYQKRELQKAADMAALSAVQNLDTENSLLMAETIAKQNIGLTDPIVVDPVLGKWSPSSNPDDSFTSTNDNPNSIKVTINKTIPTLIPFIGSINNATALEATATAVSSQPIASFTVESRLLRLLGIPVLDSKGVISVSNFLGLLTPNEVLNLQTTVGGLLKATVSAVGQNGTAADIQAVNNWASIVIDKIDPKLTIPLYGPGGIFVMADTQDPQAALASQVKISDLADIGLTVANKNNFLNLPDLKLLGETIVGQVSIVEPPAIAIGGKGTVAHSAQIRIYLNISLDSKDIPVLPALGGILEATGTSIKLPIIINVGSSHAKLDDLCYEPDKDSAKFLVTRSAVDVCIGSFQYGTPFDPGNSCENVSKETLVKLLGIPILTTKVQLNIQAASDANAELWRPPQTSAEKPTAITIPGQLALTNVGSSLLNSLLTTLSGTDIGTLTDTALRKNLANKLLAITGSVNGSVSQLNTILENSKTNLTNTGLLSAVSTVVSGALSLVGDLLKNILDLLFGCGVIPSNTCKVGNSIDDNVAKTLVANSLVQGLLGPLDELLAPLLQTSTLSVTETDLSLNGLQCGAPALVQ